MALCKENYLQNFNFLKDLNSLWQLFANQIFENDSIQKQTTLSVFLVYVKVTDLQVFDNVNQILLC